MRRKTMSQLFGEVDPQLKVVNGGSYCHQRNRQATRLDEKPATDAYRYEPRASTSEDWERGAVTCPLCWQPTVRFLPYGFLGKRKVCPGRGTDTCGRSQNKCNGKQEKMSKFVIHEHEALRAGLHHDLRLERNGVLKSWAVPKGVPEEPRVRRVAKQVEDHALSYGDFEGEIPRGLYGAGKVRIWDHGMYDTKFWSDTKIEVTLRGKRLHGDYVLRWMEKMNSWLLWKRQ